MNGFHTLSLVLAIVAPLYLSLLWFVPPWRGMVVRLTPWMALPALAVSLLFPVGTTVELHWLVLGATLGLDATGQILLFLSALVWGLGGWFCGSRLAADPARERFFGFFLPAMAGNFGLLLAFDAPSFYTFFALMSFSAYGFVIHRQDAAARRAARVYLSLVVLGEILLFAAFVMIAASQNSLSLPFKTGAAVSPVAIGLAVFGFGIKAGLLPLHFGLPLAYAAAPTPAGAVLAGAMINAGLVGWLRVLPLGQSAQPEWGTLLMALGLTAAFFGVLAGITQRDPKSLLAYSSISQMGLITLGVGGGLLSPQNWGVLQAALLLYALHHGLAKGALFLGLGVANAAGQRTRGLAAIGLALPALALAGAPLTSGVLAKTALKGATALLPAPWPEWLGLLLPLAAVGTTVLMVRFLVLAWPRAKAQSHLTAGLWLPWGLLVAAVGVTLFLWPAAAALRHGALDPAKAWMALWPVLAGALIGLALWARHRRATALPLVPAGDLLVLIEGAAAWLGRRWPGGAVTSALTAPGGIASRRLARLADRMETATLPERFEQGLQRWSIVGTVFLLMGLCFVLILLLARR